MTSYFTKTTDIAKALYRKCGYEINRKADECVAVRDLCQRHQLTLDTDEGAAALIGMAYRLGWRFNADVCTETTLADGWEFDIDNSF